MADRIWVTILSPRQVKKRYLSDGFKKTRMSKWALDALSKGYNIACVYRKGLNYSGVLFHNRYGLEDASIALRNFIGDYSADLRCVDMSHPDAFYFAYKKRH